MMVLCKLTYITLEWLNILFRK